MTQPADLLAYLFEGLPHPLAGQMAQWLEASSRCVAFVETYRDKIRKKIRVTREPESALDLCSELEVAYCLLSDRRLSVAYEPYASAKIRGPDFGVTYRANLRFNIEVARLRAELNGGDAADLATVSQDAHKEERSIVRILLGKLEQMQPGMPNLLVIHTRAEVARAIDLARLMQAVKTRVEAKDPAFYAASRYPSPATFYRNFLHLNGILLWAPGARVWINKQARPPLSEKVLRLISSLPPGASPA